MPKDLIHFKIAEKTANRLAETSFAPYLASAPCGLLLGSVFHDVLFYAVTPGGKPLEKLAHKIHGADGQDTFTLIRMQAEHARKAEDKSLPAALLVGMISHLFADAVIHPMVWYFSGNYYADAPAAKSRSRQHHRAMESLMDMAACPEMLGRSQYSLRTLLKQCGELLHRGLPVDQIASLAGMPSDAAQSQLALAWTIFAGFQSAYTMRPLARALFALRPYLPRSAAEIATLFYAPQLMRQASFLTGTISFRHPVTNEEHSATLEQMMDSVAIEAATLCAQLEPGIFTDAMLEIPTMGPSLDAGLSGVATSKMLYFAKTPFPAFT